MNGLLFPGQGSQTIGMGKELYEKVESAKTLLDVANDIVGYDIKKLMLVEECRNKPIIDFHWENYYQI